MAEFRKLLLAFAVVALLSSLAVPALAQTSANVVCSTTAGGGNPPLVRAEGLAELVGDVVLNCSGGTSTATGANVPTINIQIFLSTDVTSRLLNSDAGLTEALLIIDEPGGTLNPATPQLPCTDAFNGTPGVCQTWTGVGAPSGLNPTTGGYITPGAYGVTGRPNVFQGRWSSAQPNAITWLGVPFDPPGTAGLRTLRFTNVRGNASRLGTSSTLIPSQITEFISISGVGFITVNNPQATVAYVVNGLNAISVNTPDAFAQCLGQNKDTAGDSSKALVSSQAAATFGEGFAYSWKVRNIVQVPTLAGGAPNPQYVATTTGYSGDVVQNVPGQPYNTESGFVNTGFTSTNGLNQAGRATQGTRLFVTFNAINTGAQVFVPVAVPLYNQQSDTTVTGVAILVGTDPTGKGDTSSATSGTIGNPDLGTNSSIALSELPKQFGITTGPYADYLSGATTVAMSQIADGTAATATAVYEVIQTDVNAPEAVKFPFSVAYTPNLSQNQPAPSGTTPATLSGGFAPTSTVTTPSSSAPVPRFVPSAGTPTAFTINLCSCNLLFPWVTNQAGYDTGIAITNTSMDPFSADNAQQGTVTLNFYGTPTQAAQTTNAPVTAGDVAVFTLSSGGNYGITAAAGFQGYIIAQARFQYCHGLAFITAAGVGANGPSSTYLGIILDQPGLWRTGQTGENSAH